MKEKISKNNTGFTLIEILVAMAIIVFLTGISLRIARFSETHKNLTIAWDQFRTNIRMAQSYALSGPTVGTAAEINGSPYLCGFGVVVTSNTEYAIFYNRRANYEDCDQIDAQRYDNVAPGVSTLLEEYTLPDNVRLSNPAGTSVFFKIPYAKAYNSTGMPLLSSGQQGFTVSQISDTAFKKIIVTGTGSIR